MCTNVGTGREHVKLVVTFKESTVHGIKLLQTLIFPTWDTKHGFRKFPNINSQHMPING